MFPDSDSDRLALALAAARLGDWSWDAATNLITMSPRAGEIFGLPHSLVNPRDTVRQFLHPQDRERISQRFDEAIETGERYDVEYLVIHGPRERWVAVSGNVRYGPDGRVLGMIGIMQDRTREWIMARLEEALRPALEPSAVIQTATGIVGRHFRVNRAVFATLDGATPASMLVECDYANDVSSLGGRHPARQFGEEFERHMRDGRAFVIADCDAAQAISAAERRRYAEASIGALAAVPVMENGRPVACMMLATVGPRDWDADDIASLQGLAGRCCEALQRAQAEHDRDTLLERERLARREAEHQKQLLHSLFMQAPTLIAVLRGPDMIVELANPPMCRVWGARADQMINRPIFDVLPEARQREYRAVLEEAFRSGESFGATEVGATFEREGGALETVYVDFIYSPFRDVHGAVQGIFVIANDITQQVKARLEVDELRVKAESASRAKDQFLAMLGHELRNPLSPILTALQLMKMRGDVHLAREQSVIERQVTHLTRLVDDLLDVARIARGKVDLKVDIVELSQIVARAIEMASPLLEERTHTLQTEVAPGLLVEGDLTRLSQVVANLLTNAAKYTLPGGRVVITAWRDDDVVMLRVADTGIGISPEMLPRIFDYFAQEAQESDRQRGGLGLGLAIVRNLVERHGGTVSAHSEGLGKGSEFIVRLPLAPRLSLGSPDSEPWPTRGLVARGNIKILVVDDNHDGADTLALALRMSGYETEVAHDGPEALRICGRFTPDIAFLDLGLPVMDGYELAARLRQMPTLAHTSLIALSGYGQDADRRRTRDAGFRAHLVKPVELDIIESSIAEFRREASAS